MSKCPVSGKECHTRVEAKKKAAWLRSRSLNKRIGIYHCPDAAHHPDPQRVFHVGHKPSKSWRLRPIGAPAKREETDR